MERIIRLVEFVFLTTIGDSMKMGKSMAKVGCHQICQLLSIFKDYVLEVSESISLLNGHFRTSALIISSLFIVSGQHLQLGADFWKTTTFFSIRTRLYSERCDRLFPRQTLLAISIPLQASISAMERWILFLQSLESGLLYDC